MRVYKYTCTLHVFAYTRGGLHVPPVHMHKAIRAHSLSLRPFYWSTILPPFCLSLSFSPLSFCPDSPCLLFAVPHSLPFSLFFPLLSFSQYCSSAYAKTHQLSLCALVFHLRHSRQNRSTPCHRNGVIQERAFTPARALNT